MWYSGYNPIEQKEAGCYIIENVFGLGEEDNVKRRLSFEWDIFPLLLY